MQLQLQSLKRCGPLNSQQSTQGITCYERKTSRHAFRSGLLTGWSLLDERNSRDGQSLIQQVQFNALFPQELEAAGPRSFNCHPAYNH